MLMRLGRGGGALRLEHAIKLGGGGLRDEITDSQVAATGEDGAPSILMHDVNFDAMEAIAVLAKHVALRALAHHGIRR